MLPDETHILKELKTQQHDYQNFDLSLNTFDHFNKCRERELFTDINIKVQDEVFPCHKILLDATCPFFSSYFSFSDHQQKSNDIIVLNHVTPAAFRELLNFIYTMKLTISSDTVVDILQCADFLQFPTIVKWCSGFLLQYLNDENCYKIYEIASRHSLKHLASESWNFILENFEKFMLSDEFLEIPANDLIQILSCDLLRVSREIVLLEAVEKWMQYDFTQRCMYSEKLIGCLRISNEEIKDKKIIASLDIDVKEKDITPRFEKVLVVVSKDTNRCNFEHTLFKIICYNPNQNRWENLTNFPFNRRQMFGVCVVNNKIYLTGGVGNDMPLSDPNKVVYKCCWEYNPSSSSWREMKAMFSARFNHASAGFLDCLYVVGGRGEVGMSLMSDCAMFDLNKDQWTKIASIRGVEGVGNSALVPLDERLFLLGGVYCQKASYNGYQYYNYEEAQYFSPADGRWHELPALSRQLELNKSRVSQLDCLPVRGFLLLVDDRSGQYIHVYNPITKVMSRLMPCHGYHRSSGAIVFDDKLILSGGNENGLKPHDMVHCYDFTDPSKGWTMLPPLPVCMAGHISLALYRPATKE